MATSHDVPATALEELACYCCGTSFDANDLVRFERHPQDGVCAGCAAWLLERSLPVGHKSDPGAAAGRKVIQSCSFCGRRQKQVKTLVAGTGVFICDGCVDRVHTVLAAAGKTVSTPIGTIQRVNDENRDERCGFCGKSRLQVDGMATAAAAQICNECLDLCDEIASGNLG
jgi:hypothetical protein